MSGPQLPEGRAVQRARQLLARPGAWLAAEGSHYGLRCGPDRRSRIVLTVDEAGFRALVQSPGLHPRPQGGWCLRPTPAPAPGPAPVSEGAGRPGMILGQREVIDRDGTMQRHTANLGTSPIAWLARHKDAAGRPWLSPAERAAGERLCLDVERAVAGASLTMRWDGQPRLTSPGPARQEPQTWHLSAAHRIEAALSAVGPGLRPILSRICVHGDSLRLAETGLGLQRRQGKLLLKRALKALAHHYEGGQ